MNDAIAAAAVTGVLGFLGGWALTYVGPKSKVVYWFPHTSFFQVPQPGAPNALSLMTASVTVQNLGRRPASNVELVYNAIPAYFTLTPARTYTQNTTPQGQHIITLASLGRNEWCTVEVLAIGAVAIPPAIVQVRSHDGPASRLPVLMQRIWPPWVNWLVGILMLSGSVVLVYWILRGLKLLGQVIGVLSH